MTDFGGAVGRMRKKHIKHCIIRNAYSLRNVKLFLKVSLKIEQTQCIFFSYSFTY